MNKKILQRISRPSAVAIAISIAVVIGFCDPYALVAADEKLESLEEQAFKQAAALVEPSIVRVQTVGGLDRVGKRLTATGPTTGVVVSTDGYIISSAFNFASKPATILVQLPDGRHFPAKSVATDRSRKLTLLKIDVTDLIPAQAADGKSIRVGQWALALGRTFDNPLPSVSVGIVSARNRIWGRAIQTDAKVSPINYGGPLVDIAGKVMGILVPLSPQTAGETAGVEWYDSGIGFAVPMADVLSSVDRLKAGKDLHSGVMGILFRKGGIGARAAIGRVRIGSPAYDAGLKSGDIIVEVDKIPIRRQAQVKQVLGRKYAGETVEIAVKRRDVIIRRRLSLVDKLLPYESGFLGILPDRPLIGGDPPTGVSVRYVFDDSPAQKAGLVPGDRIVRINGTNVVNTVGLTDLVGRVRPDQMATLVYERDGKKKRVEVKLSSLPEDVPRKLLSYVVPRVADRKEAAIGSEDPKPDAGQKNAAKKSEAENPKDENSKDETSVQTGRIVVEMPAHRRSYWAYVPEHYNPQFRYSLMVWIHPGGDTMEAAIFKKWRSICERRGIMIVAPKAEKIGGWKLNEAEFVKDSVEDFMKKYTVNPARVFVHGFSDGGGFAFYLTFKYRDVFRGAAVSSASFSARSAENDPRHRLQLYLVCGEKDELFNRVEQSVTRLRALKFPVSFRKVGGGDHSYPSASDVEEMGRWADCLDRI